MKSLRHVIRQIILEKFTEKDVRQKMQGDTRQRAVPRSLYGSHAKDLFRQETEKDPKIRKFLNSLMYIHWADVPVDGSGRVKDPMASKNQNDELSANAYRKYDNGHPINVYTHWGQSIPDRLGFQIEGFVTWLEHGDAQTGRTGRGTLPGGVKNTMSGDNKQPRKFGLGRDPRKRDSMADVIFSEKDFLKRRKISSPGHGYNEALIDNWELVCIWYKEDEYEGLAQETADLLSKKYGKQIPIKNIMDDDIF